MALNDLLDRQGAEPVSVLFEAQSESAVFGLQLSGGRDVLVKAREDDGRAEACVAAQTRSAKRGFACPQPLSRVVDVGTLAVHAEEARLGDDHGGPRGGGASGFHVHDFVPSRPGARTFLRPPP